MKMTENNINKIVYKTLLEEWKQKVLPETFSREFDLERYFSQKLNKIVVLSGFRRVGKTYFLLHEIKKLLKGNKNPGKNIVYFNFEDERIPLRKDFLSNLFPEIVKNQGKVPDYLFLDEIQNFDSWSKWLRRVYDSNPKTRFFVTGSSSKMSFNKIPTELRGRYVLKKVFPLSFSEFLNFKDIESGVSELSEEKIINLFDEYVIYGGLPEIVLSGNNEKKEIANSYYYSVVNRDLIDTYNIKNKESLKAILNLLLNSTSFSYYKLYNTLKSLQYTVGKESLINYLEIIEDSYFMFSLPIFSYKIKDRMQYPKKHYFIDNIFLTEISSKFSKDYGRLYENLTAINLLRNRSNKEEIFYWKNQKNEEVDFVILKNKKPESLIQVCYDINDPDSYKREVRSLIKASDELGCDNLMILNKDSEEEIEEKWFNSKKKIKLVPLWKWLLEK